MTRVLRCSFLDRLVGCGTGAVREVPKHILGMHLIITRLDNTTTQNYPPLWCRFTESGLYLIGLLLCFYLKSQSFPPFRPAMSAIDSGHLRQRQHLSRRSGC